MTRRNGQVWRTAVCRLAIGAVVIFGSAAPGGAGQARTEGWVVIPVDEYRALRSRAYPSVRPPDPPPVDAAITRVEYDLRAAAGGAAGEARVTVDVLKEGWVRVNIPSGVLVRAARIESRAIPIVQTPEPHVLLSKPGRVVITLDVTTPLVVADGVETITIPPSAAAVSRVALVVPREGIAVTAAGGVLAERPQQVDGRWIAFGRARQPLTLSWRRRADERAAAPLKWRGGVTTLVGLGEDASSISTAVSIDVTQGAASSIDVEVPEGITVNQVAGPLVADWETRAGALRITFLEPVTARAAFTIGGELRAPRDGAVTVPLVRLPAAERETGGVAVEVLGAGEISAREPRGLDPADPADLAAPVRGRESPSMAAFTYRPQPGAASRGLTLQIARYTPQAVLVASIEEARFDVLIEEQGRTLVRARYAVRNNQRAFLAVRLPQGAHLWSATVAGRPMRPGVDATGALLLTLQKSQSGDELPAFPVEVTYFQRGAPWSDKGREQLTLPAVDLPASRSGVVLRHSPRFEVTAVTGAFHAGEDSGPFTAALRAPAPPPPPPPPAPANERVASDAAAGAPGGRIVAGPMPVEIPFPEFGRQLFLVSELTPELQAPAFEFTFKRESRW